jgi:hypothetical protein
MTPDLSDFTTIDVDWSHTPVTLRFGDASTALERIPLEGNRKALEEALTRIGKDIVNSTEAPATPMEEAERGWLQALQSAPPVFWDSTLGNVYRRQQPLPSFVATRFADPVTGPDGEAITQRIVGWGLAFPTSPGHWVIYVFHPDSAKGATSESGPAIELPRDSQNVTNLQGIEGNQWRVIQGRGDLSGWVQHFDNHFGTAATISRVVKDQAATLRYRRNKFITDVQIRTEPDGRLTGVIWSAKERGQ